MDLSNLTDEELAELQRRMAASQQGDAAPAAQYQQGAGMSAMTQAPMQSIQQPQQQMPAMGEPDPTSPNYWDELEAQQHEMRKAQMGNQEPMPGTEQVQPQPQVQQEQQYDPAQDSPTTAFFKGLGRAFIPGSDEREMGQAVFRDKVRNGGALMQPVGYAADLVSSFAGGIVGATGKVTEAAGHLLGGDGSTGKAMQKAMEDYFANDMTDTGTVGPDGEMHYSGIGQRIANIGKSVANMAGEFLPVTIAAAAGQPQFAAMYMKSLFGAGAINMYNNTVDQAVANGMDTTKARVLGAAAGATDYITNIMFGKQVTAPWFNNFKKTLARTLIADSAKSAAIMGMGGATQDVIQQMAANGEFDVERTGRKLVDGLIEGALFHLVNDRSHAGCRWVGGKMGVVPGKNDIRQANAQSANQFNREAGAEASAQIEEGVFKTAFDNPFTRTGFYRANPDAAEEIVQARMMNEQVTPEMVNRLIEGSELKYFKAESLSEGDLNAIGDRLWADIRKERLDKANAEMDAANEAGRAQREEDIRAAFAENDMKQANAANRQDRQAGIEEAFEKKDYEDFVDGQRQEERVRTAAQEQAEKNRLVLRQKELEKLLNANLTDEQFLEEVNNLLPKTVGDGNDNTLGFADTITESSRTPTGGFVVRFNDGTDIIAQAPAEMADKLMARYNAYQEEQFAKSRNRDAAIRRGEAANQRIKQRQMDQANENRAQERKADFEAALAEGDERDAELANMREREEMGTKEARQAEKFEAQNEEMREVERIKEDRKTILHDLRQKAYDKLFNVNMTDEQFNEELGKILDRFTGKLARGQIAKSVTRNETGGMTVELRDGTKVNAQSPDELADLLIQKNNELLAYQENLIRKGREAKDQRARQKMDQANDARAEDRKKDFVAALDERDTREGELANMRERGEMKKGESKKADEFEAATEEERERVNAQADREEGEVERARKTEQAMSRFKRDNGIPEYEEWLGDRKDSAFMRESYRRVVDREVRRLVEAGDADARDIAESLKWENAKQGELNLPEPEKKPVQAKAEPVKEPVKEPTTDSRTVVEKIADAFASRDREAGNRAMDELKASIEKGGKFPSAEEVAKIADRVPENMRDAFVKNMNRWREYADTVVTDEEVSTGGEPVPDIKELGRKSAEAQRKLSKIASINFGSEKSIKDYRAKVLKLKRKGYEETVQALDDILAYKDAVKNNPENTGGSKYAGDLSEDVGDVRWSKRADTEETKDEIHRAVERLQDVIPGMKVQFQETGSHGTANFNRTDNVVTMSDRATITEAAHEIGWHAARLNAEKNDPALLRQMTEYARTAPQEIKDLVNNLYREDYINAVRTKGREAAGDMLVDEIGALRFEREHTEQFREILNTEPKAKTWFGKMMDFARKVMGQASDMVDTDSEAMRKLSNEQYIDAFAKQIFAGKRLAERTAYSEFMQAEEGADIRHSFTSTAKGHGLDLEEYDDKGERKFRVMHPKTGKPIGEGNWLSGQDLLDTDSAQNEFYKLKGNALGGEDKAPDRRKIADLYAKIINEGIKMSKGNVGAMDAIWKWAGSSFEVVKSNGDTQYKLSIDLTTICKKTMQLLDVVGKFQSGTGRGAIPSEIIRLYLETGKAGFQTPCPVCYVFSHWFRSGMLLQTASQAQDHFRDVVKSGEEVKAMSEKERAAYTKKMATLYKKEAAALKKNKKRVDEAKRRLDFFYDTFDALSRALGFEWQKREAKQPYSEDKINAIQAEIERITPLMVNEYDIVSQSDFAGWLKNSVVRQVSRNKKKVWEVYDDYKYIGDEDKDILFQFTRADELVNKYPHMARFRSSKGSAGGKAIETDSDNRFGEVIAGLAGKKKNGEFYNPFDAYEDFRRAEADRRAQAQMIENPKQRNAALKAIDKEKESLRKDMQDCMDKAKVWAAKQNLRGGQRLFSWSDNLLKFGPDMFQNFQQLQAIGSGVQSYSKQLEGAHYIASMNGYNNGSLMAYKNGYRERVTVDGKDVDLWEWTDHAGKKHEGQVEIVDGRAVYRGERNENGQWVRDWVEVPNAKVHDGEFSLVFSDVQGIDHRETFKLNKKLSKSGNILVGMNDKHITLALGDGRVFFVIPWHASSLKKAWLHDMMGLLGERPSGDSQDYTKVQGDGRYGDFEKEKVEKGEELEDAPDEAEGTRTVFDLWRETEQDGGQFRSAFQVKSGSNGRSATQDKYFDLRARLMRGTATQEDLRLCAEDEFLSQVFRNLRNAARNIPESMRKDNVSSYGTLILDDADTKSIYPAEYWDEHSHYMPGKEGDTSNINGTRYLEYCRRLGFVPKFCGLQKNGTQVKYGDFHNVDGYWKLLIDRRMYDVFGNFQDIGPVDATKASLDMMTKQGVVERFGKNVVTTEADQAAAQRIADAAIKSERDVGMDINTDPALSLEKAIAKADKDEAKALGVMHHYTPEFDEKGKRKPALKENIPVLDKKGNEIKEPKFKKNGEPVMKNGEPQMRTVTKPNPALKEDKGLDVVFGEGGKIKDVRWSKSTDLDRDFPGWNKTPGSTQISTTVSTYNKIGTMFRMQHGDTKAKSMKILDASSGLGYGTTAMRRQGLNVDDVEPYQNKARKAGKQEPYVVKDSEVSYESKPATYDSYEKVPDNSYDLVVSNAVLNVIPDDWRVQVLCDMANKVKPGGDIFINTVDKNYVYKLNNPMTREEALAMGGEAALATKRPILLDQQEALARNAKGGSYQRGFSRGQLTDMVRAVLGEDWVVRPSSVNGRSIVITKPANGGGKHYTPPAEDIRWSRRKDDDGIFSTSPKGEQSSIVRNAKYGVGKDMMGKIYFHKNYASDVVPANVLARAKAIAEREGFDYNTMMYDPKSGAVRFDESPDFDTAREPHPGNQLMVNADGTFKKLPYQKQIFHHKWAWVKDDYKGFDVDESKEWSRTWLNANAGKGAPSGWMEKWNAKLDELGLPRDGGNDGEVRWSRRGVPYPGSKSRDADDIVSRIPRADRFVDLMAGGGSISHAALLSGRFGKVMSNDIDTRGLRVFTDALKGDVEKYQRVPTREEFNALPQDDPRRRLFSFNGDGQTYIGEKHIADAEQRIRALDRIKGQGEVEVSAQDVFEKIKELKDGDVGFLDPPYPGTRQRGYEKGMSEEDVARLFKAAEQAPCPVYVTANEAPEGWREVWRGREKEGHKGVEKLWVQERYADRGGEGDGKDVRWSIGSEESRNADKDTLAIAKDMIAKGYSQRETWQDTGWWRDRDGRMRFEIPYGRPDDVKKIANAMKPENLANEKVLGTRTNGSYRVGKYTTLAEILEKDDIPTLRNILDAYPQLRNMHIVYTDQEKGNMYGMSMHRKNPFSGKIVGADEIQLYKEFYRLPIEKQASGLLHELQHSIQQTEAPNSSYVLNAKYKTSPFKDKAIKKIAKELKPVLDGVGLRSSEQMAAENLQWMISDNEDGKKYYDRIREQVEKIAADNGFNSVEEMSKALSAEANKRSAFGAYMTDPVEEEARLVQRRMFMTDEERKAEAPWETMEKMLADEGYGSDQNNWNGNPVNGKYDKGAGDVRWSKSVTPGEDKKYMDAINRGDDKTALHMMREVAKRMMPETKVVDKDGLPLELYHGTQSYGFNVFNTNPGNSNYGSHFGNIDAARQFADDNGIYKVYLNIKNPLELRDIFKGTEEENVFTWHGLARRIGSEQALKLAHELEQSYPWLKKAPKGVDDLFYQDSWNWLESELGGDITTWNRYGKWKMDEKRVSDIGRELLKLGGYDGVKYNNEVEGGVSWMAMEPSQIKEVAITRDDSNNPIPLSQRFNTSNPDIRWSRIPRHANPNNGNYMDLPAQSSNQTRKEWFMKEFADRYDPLKRGVAMAYMNAHRGATMEQALDWATNDPASPYHTIRVQTGMVERDQHRSSAIQKHLEDTLANQHSLGANGFTVQDFGNYIYAKHAIDRNRQKDAEAVARGETPTHHGAGITDQQANAIINGFSPSQRTALENARTEFVHRLNEEFGLKYLHDAGLIDQDSMNRLDATYHKDYVPLKDEVVGNDSSDYHGQGSVMNPLNRATGRFDEAENPVAFLILRAQSNIVNAHENMMRQNLARFIEGGPGGANAHPEFGRVIEIRDGQRLPNDAITFRRNVPTAGGGERNARFAIELYGTRGSEIMDSIQQKNVLRTPSGWQKVARWWASMATQLSPTFSARNFVKDTTEVTMDLMATGGFGMARRFLRQQASLVPLWNPEMRQILREWQRDGRVTARGPLADMFREFASSGSLIGGGGVREGYSDMMQKFEDITARHRGISQGVHGIKKCWNLYKDAVSRFNENVELMTRFNNYMTRRNAGESVERAAINSREGSTDFGMYGNKRWMNDVWMFSNSIMGGTMRAAKSMAFGRYGRRLALGMIMMGVMEELADVAMNGAGDEDKKDKGEGTGKNISEYELENSLHMRFGDKYVKLPMHLGPFSWFKYLGNNAARVITGKQDMEKALKNIANSAVTIASHFTGTGEHSLDQGGKALANSFMPSVGIQPIAQAVSNIDYKGQKIAREHDYPGSKDAPDFLFAKEQTNPIWVNISQALNKIPFTGGSDTRAGYANIAPETIEYLANQVFKNFGKDVVQIATLPAKAVMHKTDEDLTVRDVPYARDFVKNTPDISSRYYETFRRISGDQEEFKRIAPADRHEYLQAHPFANGQLKKLGETITALSHRAKGHVKSGTGKWIPSPFPVPEDTKKQAREQMRQMMAEYVRRVEEREQGR